MDTPAHQIPGAAHLTRIDIGLGEHAAAHEDCDLMRIDFIVLRFATVDGPHVECMAEDERNLLFPAQVSNPVPGERAFHANH